MRLDAQKHAAPLLVAGCVLFGMGSLIVKFLPLGSYAVAFWRLAVAAVIFWILSRFFAQKLPQSRKALLLGLASGGMLGLDLGLWHESVHAVGPGISTLLNSLQIFFLTAIGFFLFGERLSKLQTAGLLAAVAGVAMIASPEFGHNGRAAWGLASGIVSGAMLACSMVLVRETHKVERVPLFPMMLLVSLGGMLFLLLPTVLFDRGNILPQTAGQWGMLLVYGAVMQCMAWGMIAYAVPLLSLPVTGLLLLSEPVAALFIDYFFLDKPIDALQWTGAALTLAAIYFGSQKNRTH